MESKIAEERGADEQAQTQPAVVFVVVEKVLAITVVEVQHDELIVLLADAEPHIDDGVETTALINIHRRLKLFFGPASGLCLSRSSLGGLCVCMHIQDEREET